MTNNFQKACELIEKKYTSAEIFEILKGNDDVQKAIAIMEIEHIQNQEFADLLIYHLTNHAGQIREITAFKLNEIIESYKEFFQTKKILDTIIDSLNDVNPNVVRFMLNSLEYIENKEYIFNSLFEKISTLTNEILNKNRRGKVEEHIFTKKCFKIYWSLESIKTLLIKKSDIIKKESLREKLFQLIKDLSDFEEYTIREKIAQITNLIDVEEINQIKLKLKEDENYFVKRMIV